jgi:hypothetical protein
MPNCIPRHYVFNFVLGCREDAERDFIEVFVPESEQFKKLDIRVRGPHCRSRSSEANVGFDQLDRTMAETSLM